jgi:hypothetical protein
MMICDAKYSFFSLVYIEMSDSEGLIGKYFVGGRNPPPTEGIRFLLLWIIVICFAVIILPACSCADKKPEAQLLTSRP